MRAWAAAMFFGVASAAKTVTWGQHAYEPLVAAVGEEVQFVWVQEAHDVWQFDSREAMETCDFGGARLVAATTQSGYVYTATEDPGYFGCSIGAHCTMGQQTIEIVGSGSLPPPDESHPDGTGACYGVPPAYQAYPETARWLAHQSLFGIMSTLSSFDNIFGAPFGNVKSFVDGPVDGATGRIFLYASAGDASMRDILLDDRVSLTLSEEVLDGGTYCTDRGVDIMDPTCARISFSGNIRLVCTRLECEDEEFLQYMDDSMFDRHPGMLNWPVSHDWGFYEIDISHIWIISFYGQAVIVDVDEYFAVECSVREENTENSGTSTTPVAGVVVGVLAGVAAVAGVGALALRRYKQQSVAGPSLSKALPLGVVSRNEGVYTKHVENPTVVVR